MSFISEETKYNKSEYVFQESDTGVKLFIFMTKTLIKIRKSIMGRVPMVIKTWQRTARSIRSK